MTRIGTYQVIGAHRDRVDSPSDPKMIVLDTCVAIDLKDFYFGGPTRNQESLKRLLLEFPLGPIASLTPDINFGWALSEASWSRSGVFNVESARRVKYACSQILGWDVDKIDDEFSRRYPPEKRDPSWWRKVPIPSVRDVEHPYPLMVATYGLLLKAVQLQLSKSTWKQRGAFYGVEQLYAWMKDDLGILQHFEFAVAVDLLLGRGTRKRSVDRLLRLGGMEAPEEIANRVWNAAWDVWFTRLPEGFSYGLLGGVAQQPAVLVTANKDPGYLRDIAEVRMIVDDGLSKIPVNEMNWEADLAEAHRLDGLLHLDLLESRERDRRDFDAVYVHAVSEVGKLEREIGLEETTQESLERVGIEMLALDQ